MRKLAAQDCLAEEIALALGRTTEAVILKAHRSGIKIHQVLFIDDLLMAQIVAYINAQPLHTPYAQLEREINARFDLSGTHGASRGFVSHLARTGKIRKRIR